MIKITRVLEDNHQTLSIFTVFDMAGSPVHRLKALELPWRDNERRVSRIPAGNYQAIKHISPKFGPCLWLQDVSMRSEILIHKGNYNRDTLGCILPGLSFRDIDGDGHLDVVSSVKAMDLILAAVSNIIRIEIVERFDSNARLSEFMEITSIDKPAPPKL